MLTRAKSNQEGIRPLLKQAEVIISSSEGERENGKITYLIKIVQNRFDQAYVYLKA